MKDDIRLLTIVALLNSAALAFLTGFMTGIISLLLIAHGFHG